MVTPIAQIRKSEIIQATVEALAKKGLPMPSYDAIAAEAGMSRQLIRHYFPDAEVLMAGVCDRLVASSGQPFARYRELPTGDRLSFILDRSLDLPEGPDSPDAGRDRVRDSLVALASRSEMIRESVGHCHSSFAATLAAELRNNHPALDEGTSTELGFLLVGMIAGYRQMVITLGFDPGHLRAARAAMDRLIRSYVGNAVAVPDDPLPREMTPAGE